MKREKAKILVVEDNPATRELLREFLSQEGYTVRVARDGKEALLRVRKDNFDLVLTDVKMPRMDGVQLLKELQKIIPHTKVVIVTATADSEIAVKVMKLGAYDYITKPFCLDSILQKVEKALGDSSCKYSVEMTLCELTEPGFSFSRATSN